jgi:hypothetical protein
MIPRPPFFFGLHIIAHAAKELILSFIFFLHKQCRRGVSITSITPTKIIKDNIKYVGKEERTELTNTSLSPYDKK